MRSVLLLWLTCCLLSGCDTQVRHPPGVLAPEAPVQERLSSAPVFQRGEYVIRPVARFAVHARVLSTQRYRFGRDAELSPVDLALGWGRMSDQAVLDRIDVSQGGRFYRWRVENYPIPRREIIEQSANMHMLPANDAVLDDLLAVREGDLVAFEGYLVTVTAPDGWHWNSSTTRKDTGNGACEVVWVERLVAFPPDVDLSAY